jgi:hypothetical protein
MKEVCFHSFPVVTVTVFKYRNKIDKIVVKAVPYKDKEVNNVNNFFVNV